jgi:predicted DNA-binding protein
MMATRKGRPTKLATTGQRVSLGLRVTAEIKERLDRAAKESGRSQSQEAELRLERSFLADRLDEMERHILDAINIGAAHGKSTEGGA